MNTPGNFISASIHDGSTIAFDAIPISPIQNESGESVSSSNRGATSEADAGVAEEEDKKSRNVAFTITSKLHSPNMQCEGNGADRSTDVPGGSSRIGERSGRTVHGDHHAQQTNFRSEANRRGSRNGDSASTGDPNQDLIGACGASPGNSVSGTKRREGKVSNDPPKLATPSPVSVDGDNDHQRAREQSRHSCVPSGNEHNEIYRRGTFGKYAHFCPRRASNTAKQGFYYTGERDVVRCFSCGGETENWLRQCTHEITHSHSPDCSMATGNDMSNVPDDKGQFYTEVLRLLRSESSSPIPVHQRHDIKCEDLGNGVIDEKCFLQPPTRLRMLFGHASMVSWRGRLADMRKTEKPLGEAIHPHKINDALDKRSTEKTYKTEVITPEGGRIELHGCEIRIPVGAVDKSTEVTISVTNNLDDFPKSLVAISSSLECKYEFNVPVHVKLTTWFNETSGKRIRVWILSKSSQSSDWNKIKEVTLDERNTVEYEVSHFCRHAAAVSEEDYEKGFHRLFNDVWMHNKTAWILSLFCKDEKSIREARESVEDGYERIAPIYDEIVCPVGSTMKVEIECLSPDGMTFKCTNNARIKISKIRMKSRLTLIFRPHPHPKNRPADDQYDVMYRATLEDSNERPIEGGFETPLHFDWPLSSKSEKSLNAVPLEKHKLEGKSDSEHNVQIEHLHVERDVHLAGIGNRMEIRTEAPASSLNRATE